MGGPPGFAEPVLYFVQCESSLCLRNRTGNSVEPDHLYINAGDDCDNLTAHWR